MAIPSLLNGGSSFIIGFCRNIQILNQSTMGKSLWNWELSCKQSISGARYKYDPGHNNEIEERIEGPELFLYFYTLL